MQERHNDKRHTTPTPNPSPQGGEGLHASLAKTSGILLGGRRFGGGGGSSCVGGGLLGGGVALLSLLLRLRLLGVVAGFALQGADAVEQTGDAIGRLRALGDPCLGLLD